MSVAFVSRGFRLNHLARYKVSLPAFYPLYQHHQFHSNPANMSSGLTPVLSKDACPPAGPYSQAIKAAGQVWVAGQIPADASGNLVTGSIGDKTKQCCENLKAILEAAGSEIPKVVRVGVFLTDMANFAGMNAEYEKWFTHKPARTCVAVRELPKGVDVEIEAIAIQ